MCVCVIEIDHLVIKKCFLISGEPRKCYYTNVSLQSELPVGVQLPLNKIIEFDNVTPPLYVLSHKNSPSIHLPLPISEGR